MIEYGALNTWVGYTAGLAAKIGYNNVWLGPQIDHRSLDERFADFKKRLAAAQAKYGITSSSQA